MNTHYFWVPFLSHGRRNVSGRWSPPTNWKLNTYFVFCRRWLNEEIRIKHGNGKTNHVNCRRKDKYWKPPFKRNYSGL